MSRSTLLSVRPEEGSRRVALSFVREAQAACQRLAKDGAEAGNDAEALHDLRVALRRLRSAMRAYQQVLDEAVPKKRRKNLRSLVQSTNEARDAEVQLAWIEEHQEGLSEIERLGADAWRRGLETTKHHAYRQIIDDKVPRLRTLLVQLARDLSEYDVHCVVFSSDAETFGEVASDTLALLLRDLEKALARVRAHEDESEAHEARIVGKRLRYVLEPLREASPEASDALRELKKLQDVLGALQDLAVRTHALSKAVEDAALARARTEVGLVVNDERRKSGQIDTEPGLLALLRLAQNEKRRVLDEVIADWATGPNFSVLSEALSRAVRALGGEDEIPREIERKYLLATAPPELLNHSASRLEQGYVPGGSIIERVRRKVDAKGDKKHFRTVKLGRGIERIEIEEEVTAELFIALYALTKGRRVRKKRYAIVEGAYTWEIDVFTDRELVLAEVELPSADIRPELPSWLEPYVVREVTDEDAYVNVNLAQ